MSKAKILVVDDSSLARRTVRHALEERGYTIEEACDGVQALERLFVAPPDLIILDMVMKGMYGNEVLAKMLQMKPDQRVIIVTADVQHSTAELVRTAGAKGLLNKPVNGARLAAAVEAVLAGGTAWS